MHIFLQAQLNKLDTCAEFLN